MSRWSVALGLLLWLLAGCATPYWQGQSALRQGRYADAAKHFEEVLSRDPGRVGALAGLGISRYKEGEFDEAVAHLSRAAERDPKHEAARLYLALSYLRKGEDGQAEEQFTALRQLGPARRLAAQVDRTLKVMRQDAPLTDETREFIAASLEDEAESAREVQEARQAYAFPHSFAYRDCFVTGRHRIVCF